MPYNYKILSSNTQITSFDSFTYNDVNYPPLWLDGISLQELSYLGIQRLQSITSPTEIVPLAITPENPQIDLSGISPTDIVNLQSARITEAFTYMLEKLDDATVNVFITSQNLNCPFGCDKFTQENIIGINTAITVGINIPDPRLWSPKGYPYPVNVSHSELAKIGEAIINKKDELYGVYFYHKSNIMMSSDYLTIYNYNFKLGY